MLAKLTSKNQLTLLKDVVSSFPDIEYFEMEAINGQIMLTPVCIQGPMRCAPSWQVSALPNRMSPTPGNGHAVDG